MIGQAGGDISRCSHDACRNRVSHGDGNTKSDAENLQKLSLVFAWMSRVYGRIVGIAVGSSRQWGVSMKLLGPAHHTWVAQKSKWTEARKLRALASKIAGRDGLPKGKLSWSVRVLIPAPALLPLVFLLGDLQGNRSTLGGDCPHLWHRSCPSRYRSRLSESVFQSRRQSVAFHRCCRRASHPAKSCPRLHLFPRIRAFA